MDIFKYADNKAPYYKQELLKFINEFHDFKIHGSVYDFQKKEHVLKERRLHLDSRFFKNYEITHVGNVFINGLLNLAMVIEIEEYAPNTVKTIFDSSFDVAVDMLRLYFHNNGKYYFQGKEYPSDDDIIKFLSKFIVYSMKQIFDRG